jgi:hypothetical protein
VVHIQHLEPKFSLAFPFEATHTDCGFSLSVQEMFG